MAVDVDHLVAASGPLESLPGALRDEPMKPPDLRDLVGGHSLTLVRVLSGVKRRRAGAVDRSSQAEPLRWRFGFWVTKATVSIHPRVTRR